MTNSLAALVARFGHRISNLDARRAGFSACVLAEAAVAGRAKVESAHTVGGCRVVTYVVFA